MIIYKITNILNNKIYIGQTTQSLIQRWRKHCAPSSQCSVLSNAIKKYGKENFKIEQIDSAISLDDLNEKEIYWIKCLNSITPYGYNRTFGGTTRNVEYIVSDETRRKLSEIRKGKKLSKETRQKISEIRKKTKLSNETLKRLSENGRKYRHSDDIKKKMSEIKLKNSPYSKSVVAIDKQNKEFEFNNVDEASNTLGIKKYSITRVLSGERNAVYGFKFKYKMES